MKQQLSQDWYWSKGFPLCEPQPTEKLLQTGKMNITVAVHSSNIWTYKYMWFSQMLITLRKYLWATDLGSFVEVKSPHQGDNHSPTSKLKRCDSCWKWIYFQNLWCEQAFCLLDFVSLFISQVIKNHMYFEEWNS